VVSDVAPTVTMSQWASGNVSRNELMYSPAAFWPIGESSKGSRYVPDGDIASTINAFSCALSASMYRCTASMIGMVGNLLVIPRN
jgi:hypothetical protein